MKICGSAFGARLWGRSGDNASVRQRIITQAPRAAAAVWKVLLAPQPISTFRLCARLFAACLAGETLSAARAK